jgi:hypothetical protein
MPPMLTGLACKVFFTSVAALVSMLTHFRGVCSKSDVHGGLFEVGQVGYAVSYSGALGCFGI